MIKVKFKTVNIFLISLVSWSRISLLKCSLTFYIGEPCCVCVKRNVALEWLVSFESVGIPNIIMFLTL